MRRVPIESSGDGLHFEVDFITRMRTEIEELKADFKSLIHCVSQLKKIQMEVDEKLKHVDHMKDMNVADMEGKLHMKIAKLERKLYIFLALICILVALVFMMMLRV